MSGERNVRNEIIVDQLREGATLVEVAEDFGITKQRVSQIAHQNGHLPTRVRRQVLDSSGVKYCPECRAVGVRIRDTRTSHGGNGVRRRRECPTCLHRWSTYEFGADFIESVLARLEASEQVMRGLGDLARLTREREP